jgi:hypothetical protein
MIDPHVTEEHVNTLIDALTARDKSPCVMDQNALMLIARDWRTASMIKRRVTEKGLAVPVSLRIHPGSMPGGCYFWIKSEILHWLSGADGISTHVSIYDRFPELMKHYNERGFCVGVYGGDEDKLLAYRSIADYGIVDVPNGTVWHDVSSYSVVAHDPNSYDSARLLYDVTLAVYSILLILWVFIGVIAMCFMYQRWADRKGYNKVDTESRMMATKFVNGSAE